MTPSRAPRRRVPCAADPELFFSPVPADRDLAKRICGTCLQRLSCGELGRDEVWGVWGGEDCEQREAERLTAEMAGGVLEAAQVHRASRSCYTAGCRRAECRALNAEYVAGWRDRAPVTAPRKLVLAPQLAIALEAS